MDPRRCCGQLAPCADGLAKRSSAGGGPWPAPRWPAGGAAERAHSRWRAEAQWNTAAAPRWPAGGQAAGAQRQASSPRGPAGELAMLGLNLLKQEGWTDTEPVLRECLTLRERLATGGNQQVLPWQIANTKSMLGEALAGQEKYADAEPLLLAGYEGLKENEATIPPQGKFRLTEALQRLIDFHAATDRPEKAAEWQTKLDATTPKEPETMP